MCGIVGYIGKEGAIPILLEGLKRLEYRGYDSAGICVQQALSLGLYKQAGSIAKLEKVVPSVKATVGIGHTRWATHGEPTTPNAHPHMNMAKSLAIVHNGIIENADVLRASLEKKGTVFKSQTDSEVLAHLIDMHYSGDIVDAVQKTLKQVIGTFGLVVIHKDEDKLVAARNGSPLVIGIGKEEMFIASDVSAIISYTKNVQYLNDNELAIISKDQYGIIGLDGSQKQKDVCIVDWTVEQTEKQGYDHFMLKEINEQPTSIANGLRGRWRNGRIKISADIDAAVKRIIITACGTSFHAGLLGKYLIEHFARIPVEVDVASEFRYRNPVLTENDHLIAISQSGETADTLAAIRQAISQRVQTLGLVNVVGSTIAREVDSGIYLHAGPEISVASTKAFTSQVTALLLVALHLRQQKGLNIDAQVTKDITALPDLIAKSIMVDISSAVSLFENAQSALYLGRGWQYPVALEGALKLKEISYIHAEGYAAAEMKHGPIALIDEHMPVVCLIPKDETYEKMMSNVQEVKARKGKVIGVVQEITPEIQKHCDAIIQVPKASSAISALLMTIPLQLLAYEVAIAKGINVDKPRNLAKSVTVE